MAIKSVDEIPETLQQKRESYRAMIRRDINEALDNHITKFEFEGDYNFKYLGQYAREEADRVFRSRFFYPAAQKIRTALKEKNPEQKYFFGIPSAYDCRGRAIVITTKKGEDRIHVYGYIDWDFLNNLEDWLFKETERREKEYAERKKEREERRARIMNADSD